MICVVIESPLAGDLEQNQRYVRLCMIDCLRRGEAPFASHALYPQCLDDTLAEDRRLGMDAGFAWGRKADRCAVYIDLGESRGMRAGIDRAMANGVPVAYRKLPTDLMEQLDAAAPVAIRPTKGAA